MANVWRSKRPKETIAEASGLINLLREIVSKSEEKSCITCHPLDQSSLVDSCGHACELLLSPWLLLNRYVFVLGLAEF